MASKGQKGRKIGRNAKRPSNKRYLVERRAEKNKRLKMERHDDQVAAKTIQPPKVPRGTARAERRQHFNEVAA
jgi:hypothetical protein